nr:hypothetical protein [Tanacetum cinerariifolium]
SLSSLEADSDGGVIGLAISLPLNLVDALDLVEDDWFDVGAYGDIVKSVSIAVCSGTAGVSSIAGAAGSMIVMSLYGPSRMHFLKTSSFGLVSMYLRKRDCYLVYLPVTSIGGRSLELAAMILLCI